jgi:hypothetical protein
MARVTLREVLLEALLGVYNLAGYPSGPLREAFDTLPPAALRELLRSAIEATRNRVQTRHAQLEEALKMALAPVELNRGWYESVDDRLAKLPKVEPRLTRRRETLYAAQFELGRIMDELWLTANATAGNGDDKPDHDRLARARLNAIRRTEPRLKEVDKKINDVLWGFDDEEDA